MSWGWRRRRRWERAWKIADQDYDDDRQWHPSPNAHAHARIDRLIERMAVEIAILEMKLGIVDGGSLPSDEKRAETLESAFQRFKDADDDVRKELGL